MDFFRPEVIEELDYYVYMLLDPRNGKTFYIGKGKGNRVFDHVRGTPSKRSEADSEKIQRIGEILARGLTPMHVIHRHGMTEDVALEVEASLIDYVWNELANQISGVRSNDYGPATTEELHERYGLEEWERGANDTLLLIKVRQETVDERGGIYQATRWSWYLNPNNAQSRDYVLSIVYGVCKGVFRNCKWSEAGPRRYEFVGEEVPKGDPVYERYVNKRVPKEYVSKRGAANPILYAP